MSSAGAHITPVSPSGEQDPFRFGWRYVRHMQPDGTETLRQVPLTLEDLLHPMEGDVYVENTRHERDRRYLQNWLEKRAAQIPAAVSLSDVRVVWPNPEVGAPAPDIAVFFDVTNPQREWSTFDVAQEGARTVLVIEVVSPDSRVNDVQAKFQEYYQAGVPLYVIVDRVREDAPLEIRGYRHTTAGYVLLPLDADGRLFLEPVGLLLGVKGNRAVLYDAETQEELPDFLGVTEALETQTAARQSAERKAARERAKARKADEEAAQEREKARKAAERAAKEQEKARKAAERAAKEREKARKAEAEAAELKKRLRELEEQLRRLPGEGAGGSRPGEPQA
jgi:Uma2 family endonuclease